MRAQWLWPILGVPVLATGIFAWKGVLQRGKEPLSTGKFISPMGSQVEVGSYPANLVASPDGQYLAVSDIGFRQSLTLLNASDGSIAAQVDFNGNSKVNERSKAGLYYGLAFAKGEGGKTLLCASQGAEDAIGLFVVGRDGSLAPSDPPIRLTAPAEADFPLHIAGLSASPEGGKLYAVLNQTHEGNGFRGAVALIDLAARKLVRRIDVGGYPYAVAATESKVYVGCERDGEVFVLDRNLSKALRRVRTGANPVGMFLNKDRSRLFVANSGSDTVSVIDTGTDRVLKTVLLRPPQLNLPGATPIACTLSPDETRLYVALADMNAVAVLQMPDMKLLGHIPAGWYPTSLAFGAGGNRLFVANAKGINLRNPNGKPVGSRGTYIQNIIEGTVAAIDLRTLPSLEACSELVMENNRIRPGLAASKLLEFKNPGIEHVIYIIKENRTYDQVLGDMPRGNGDPSLVLFGREVTPNQHALAERFVLMDNFFVCAEVSADGWNWSTSAMANPYVSRNTVYNYSDRGRAYDFEGSNSNAPVDLLGKKDVARPPGGYLWDNALKHGVSLRNYGLFMVVKDSEDKRFDSVKGFDEQIPNKKALLKVTDPNFRRYDLAYADSDAWVRHNSPSPVQLKAYGAYEAPSRFSAWKREFDAFVRKGNMPRLMLLRHGNDHTWGTAAGRFSPRAMASDNDYAVGQIVEAVSRSSFWKKTAIFILEDDAQAGQDHVDAHRSTAYVISPFVKRGLLYSKFGNTASMIRTIELLLGMPPMNQYDAVAPPLDVFGSEPTNLEPFTAILPPKEIVCEVNRGSAYRSADSARLINRYQEESMPDIELNDILWTSIKGKIKPVNAAPRKQDMDDD